MIQPWRFFGLKIRAPFTFIQWVSSAQSSLRVVHYLSKTSEMTPEVFHKSDQKAAGTTDPKPKMANTPAPATRTRSQAFGWHSLGLALPSSNRLLARVKKQPGMTARNWGSTNALSATGLRSLKGYIHPSLIQETIGKNVKLKRLRSDIMNG